MITLSIKPDSFSHGKKGHTSRYFDIKLIYCKEGGVVFKHTTMFEITVYEVSDRNSYLFNTYKNVTEINQLISVQSCSKSAVLMCVPQIQ